MLRGCQPWLSSVDVLDGLLGRVDRALLRRDDLDLSLEACIAACWGIVLIRFMRQCLFLFWLRLLVDYCRLILIFNWLEGPLLLIFCRLRLLMLLWIILIDDL